MERRIKICLQIVQVNLLLMLVTDISEYLTQILQQLGRSMYAQG